jgi:phosphate starvation-inducible membrane PsiE
MLKHDIIIEITVTFVWEPSNCKSKMAKIVLRGTKNGYEILNSIIVFMIFYKFTTFITKIMFGILK